MAEDHEKLGADTGSGMETALAVSLLRQNDEYRATGCITLPSALFPGYGSAAVVIPGWQQRASQQYPRMVEP
jgi:hypothetical protein